MSNQNITGDNKHALKWAKQAPNRDYSNIEFPEIPASIFLEHADKDLIEELKKYKSQPHQNFSL